ncbi:hypothetical protein P9850_01295 [Anoxybacillus rupiensis]|uniref:Swarming motility protein SwrB n=1 Tax=Anoxybacteroides rupiense TaxID=311460 RepID=A0ABD5IQE8_9BACL|nr:hypothetical protein [Anoxybacillus rupiensis]
MIAFLLTVSFALHAFSLFIIILLYLQLSKVKEVEKKQSQLIQEMEETISAYLLEWKEENERFLQALSQRMRSRDNVQTKPSPAPKQHSAPVKDDEWLPPMEQVDTIKDRIEISETNQQQKEVPSSPSSIAEQAEQLQKEGKTIEEIAKLLNKGKTEIELLLKFRQM